MAMDTFNSSKRPIVGVLLVHGFNGGRRDLAEMEACLQARGIVTKNMLLPGHGTHVGELMLSNWMEWEEAVHSELRTLKQQCESVFLVGHSMGGSLSLYVAAHEEVAGIVTMCAPLYMQPWLGCTVRVAKRLTPFVPVLRTDVRDPRVQYYYRRGVYRWIPMSAVESLLRFLPHLRAELPQVTAPALIMVSVHDHVVPARDGREIYKLLGSQEKNLVTFHRSFHMLMMDHDREEVFAKTLAFITRHAGKAKAYRDTIGTEQAAGRAWYPQGV